MPTCDKDGTTWLDVSDPTKQSPCPTCEVERLQAIVDKLPKTADQVRVMWGDYVWSLQLTKWRINRIDSDGFIELDNEMGSRFWRRAVNHYSTQAAAEAAKGK